MRLMEFRKRLVYIIILRGGEMVFYFRKHHIRENEF